MKELEELTEAIRELHQVGYDSVADEVYNRAPHCVECGMSWPCATVQLLGPVLPRCTCGWGGQHMDENMRCERSQAIAALEKT